jgi:hypothetical protein
MQARRGRRSGKKLRLTWISFLIQSRCKLNLTDLLLCRVLFLHKRKIDLMLHPQAGSPRRKAQDITATMVLRKGNLNARDAEG